MKRRFLQLEPRQQLFVAVGVMLVVVALASGVLLQLHQSQQRAQQQLQQTATELVQVKTLALQVAALHANDLTAASDAVDMTTVVSRSLQAFGLQPARMQQGATDELQLRFDAVAYEDAIGWLDAVERNTAVLLQRATFSQGQNGTVNLAVSLKKR